MASVPKTLRSAVVNELLAAIDEEGGVLSGPEAGMLLNKVPGAKATGLKLRQWFGADLLPELVHLSGNRGITRNPDYSPSSSDDDYSTSSSDGDDDDDVDDDEQGLGTLQGQPIPIDQPPLRRKGNLTVELRSRTEDRSPGFKKKLETTLLDSLLQECSNGGGGGGASENTSLPSSFSKRGILQHGTKVKFIGLQHTQRADLEGAKGRIDTYSEPSNTYSVIVNGRCLNVQPKFLHNLDEEKKKENFLLGRFFPKESKLSAATKNKRGTATLVGSEVRPHYSETGLFGRTLGESPDDVYLNLKVPFCIIALGVQGSGKSHTVATIVESCLLPFNEPTENPLVKLESSMAVLALHFGKNSDDTCELSGLVKPLPELTAFLGTNAPCAKRLVVLVSPSNYKQRLAYYEGSAADVYPLLFRWSNLTATHLRALMRLDDEASQQLYVSVALDLLRKYQKKAKVPEFNDFMAEVEDLCTSGSQAAPLRQRLQLLESFVAESQGNADLKTISMEECIAPGVLVIADLTDDLMSGADANAVFAVLLEQFRAVRVDAAKLVVLDEAHRYLSGKSGLATGVVDATRVMRHEGMRVLLSTQSPLTLPPEVLELASMAVLHGFHSHDWYTYLSSKLALPADGFKTVRHLIPGEALVFASKKDLSSVDGSVDADNAVVRVRERLTADLGASRR